MSLSEKDKKFFLDLTKSYKKDLEESEVRIYDRMKKDMDDHLAKMWPSNLTRTPLTKPQIIHHIPTPRHTDHMYEKFKNIPPLTTKTPEVIFNIPSKEGGKVDIAVVFTGGLLTQDQIVSKTNSFLEEIRPIFSKHNIFSLDLKYQKVDTPPINPVHNHV